MYQATLQYDVYFAPGFQWQWVRAFAPDNSCFSLAQHAAHPVLLLCV